MLWISIARILMFFVSPLANHSNTVLPDHAQSRISSHKHAAQAANKIGRGVSRECCGSRGSCSFASICEITCDLSTEGCNSSFNSLGTVFIETFLSVLVCKHFENMVFLSSQSFLLLAKEGETRIVSCCSLYRPANLPTLLETP